MSTETLHDVLHCPDCGKEPSIHRWLPSYNPEKCAAVECCDNQVKAATPERAIAAWEAVCLSVACSTCGWARKAPRAETCDACAGIEPGDEPGEDPSDDHEVDE